MMNIKEKFGCDWCEKVGRPFHYSNAKILAYVNEQTLENVVAGAELISKLKTDSMKIVWSDKDKDRDLSWSNMRESFTVKTTAKFTRGTFMDFFTSFSAALNRLLGEEKEGA